jgi:hypothetical protein
MRGSRAPNEAIRGRSQQRRINVARAIGPGTAGVLVAAAGPWPYSPERALHIGIIAALMQWKWSIARVTLPAERFATAMRVGMRFVMHANALQVVLVRGAAFFICRRPVVSSPHRAASRVAP